MKKFLIIAISLLIVLAGYSQTDSTIKVPVRFVINALRAKDSLDIMVKEVDSLRSLKSQYEVLQAKDSNLFIHYSGLINIADKMIANLDSQIADQKKIYADQQKINLNLNKIIRKKNWEIIKIGGVSVAVIGTLTYLLIAK